MPLIEGHMILVQERPHFGLEIPLAEMVFLHFDVLDQGPGIRFPISVKPTRPISAGLLLFFSVLVSLTALGCKSTAPSPIVATATTTPYPPRPDTTPAPFKLLHQTDNSLILVVPETTPDPALAALLYQLKDAAQTHTFAQLHLPQKFIDARQPKIFFHLYRGPKCAPETYAKGPYPCGASYHGAADFSIGGFANPNATDGSLVAPDGAVTHLWSAE